MSSEQNIPSPGLGTWQIKNPKKCINSVKTALETGYRHIDTAQIYGNEEFVGKGIEQSKTDRDEIFLATKVWIDNLSSNDVISSTEDSLDKLRTDYVDLLYVHWPGGDYNPEETLSSFKELADQNKIKHIGVSNFSIEMIEEAQEATDGSVFANQVEMHPLLQQEEMFEYCQENDIYLVAYSPLARGNVFEIEVLSELAEKYDVSEALISLAWLQSKENVIPIPKSSTEEHIRDNFASRDLSLNKEDIRKIDNIEKEKRLLNPGYGIKWD